MRDRLYLAHLFMEAIATQELSSKVSAIIHIFNNTLISDAAGKIIRVKGICQPERGQNYSGFYYDQLKVEMIDAWTLGIAIDKGC